MRTSKYVILGGGMVAGYAAKEMVERGMKAAKWRFCRRIVRHTAAHASGHSISVAAPRGSHPRAALIRGAAAVVGAAGGADAPPRSVRLRKRVDAKTDIALVREARKGLGDQIDLMIDAGLAWDAKTAIKNKSEHGPRFSWRTSPRQASLAPKSAHQDSNAHSKQADGARQSASEHGGKQISARDCTGLREKRLQVRLRAQWKSLQHH